MNVGCSPGYSDHEMVEFRMLQRGNKAKAGSQLWASGEQNFTLEGSEGSAWKNAMGGLQGSRRAG